MCKECHKEFNSGLSPLFFCFFLFLISAAYYGYHLVSVYLFWLEKSVLTQQLLSWFSLENNRKLKSNHAPLILYIYSIFIYIQNIVLNLLLEEVTWILINISTNLIIEFTPFVNKECIWEIMNKPATRDAHASLSKEVAIN